MAIGQGTMTFHSGAIRREEMFEMQRNLTEYMNLVCTCPSAWLPWLPNETIAYSTEPLPSVYEICPSE
jgi:hypothetical protein